MTEDITAEIADRVPGWSYWLRPWDNGWKCDAMAMRDGWCLDAEAGGAAEAMAAVTREIKRMEARDGR